MVKSNHYKILEVSQKATQPEIKQAYRRLVKQFHPDSHCETANHDKIVMINAAYEVLGDPQRRRAYDQQLSVGDTYDFSTRRQQRTAEAQNRYQSRRKAEKAREVYLDQWYNQTYVPLIRLISQIIRPLNSQIEALSADPFDDELMETFQDYLENCRHYLNQAKYLFSAQPNPPKLAKVAANLYYCLNQVSDGIEELELFTLNYDDHHLHTGQELFRIAYRLRGEAQKYAKAYV
ncbi:heat shock protein DnaJ domain protein [Gloeothece citriformis PCC 7424]|uniref:Heat shock protein DnaJ domain protein n=1 Tax=Gloeothece citriformis (strain PCC 7424) TaxID=65393 RepID=B7K8I4_GLOC7|nr:J domain-containing protein [Gloeothece citriformis]ACK69944.1 heat shock protein DnaJ domain protein [Gloeothece citriformis PCC 7424]